MPLPRLPALTARESRRRSGRHTEVQLPAAGLVRYLALLASVGGTSNESLIRRTSSADWSMMVTSLSSVAR